MNGRIRPSLISYRRTFNLGDYESVQLEESIIIEPMEGDSEEEIEQIRQLAWERAKADVKDQAQSLLTWRRTKREESLKFQMMQLPKVVRDEMLSCLQVWVDDAELADWNDDSDKAED